MLERLSRFLAPSLSTKGSPPLLEAVASLLEAKKLAGRRPIHITNLRQYLHAFSRGREGLPVAALRVADVEEWLMAKHPTPGGRATGINRLSTLFSYSVRKGWIQSNPCALVERVSIDRQPPKILTVDQSRALLRACMSEVRPWVTLCLLAGFRPTEAERMDWAGMRLKDSRPSATIDGAASKVRRRRIVPLPDAACAWLALDARESGPVVSSRSTLRRFRAKAAGVAGVEWSPDVLRHTFASMRVAAGHPIDTTADEMGTSRRILLTHYRELVRPEDAAEFWRIMP